MTIRYKNKKLEKICTDASFATKKYSQIMAKRIFKRIGEIKAADNIDILVNNIIGRCHQLTGNKLGYYAMDLEHPFRLVFKVDKTEMIQIAEIYEIVDYH